MGGYPVLSDNVFRSPDFDDNTALTDRNANRARFGLPALPPIKRDYTREMISPPSGKSGAKPKQLTRSQGKREASSAKKGGQGDEVPHSTRNPLERLSNSAKSDQSEESERFRSLTDRLRFGRGKRLSWGENKQQIARAFELYGLPATAARVRRCGGYAMVWDCGECGCTEAGAVVLTGCDSRSCAQCAKKLARERVDRLAPAFGRVPGYFRARVAGTVETLTKAVMDQIDLVDYWKSRGNKTREAASEEKRSLAKWQLERAKEDTWSYKLLTISPKWNPWEESEYSIERIRQRIEDCFARFARIWAKINCGGLAAAITSVEMSEGGHIHLHACLWMPIVYADHLEKLAGCFIDIREVSVSAHELRRMTAEEALYKAIKESVKYTVKAPTPKWDWINGARRRVVHPELVVRWCLATKNVQMGRNYGLMHDALKAQKASEAGKDPAKAVADNETCKKCYNCGAPLTGFPRVVTTRALARLLSEWEFRERVEWRPSTGRMLSPLELARGVMTPKPDFAKAFSGDPSAPKTERDENGRAIFGDVFHPKPSAVRS